MNLIAVIICTISLNQRIDVGIDQIVKPTQDESAYTSPKGSTTWLGAVDKIYVTNKINFAEIVVILDYLRTS